MAKFVKWQSLSLNTTHIVGGSEPEDRWYNFEYNKRYLDALASIFCVYREGVNNKSPVSAIAEIATSRNFNLSYNSSIIKGSPTEKIVRRVESFLNSYVAHSHYIGDSKQLEVIYKKLLAKYMIFNFDFNAGNAIRDWIEAFVKYDKPLAHTANQYFDKLYLSIQSLCKKLIEAKPSPLKMLYQTEAAEKEAIEEYFYALSLLDKINDDPFYHELYTGLFEKIIRPYQDVTKLLDYLSKDKSTIKINILPNPCGLHAETNVAVVYYYDDSEYYSTPHIGVSRLCCAVCHEVLLKGYPHPHRGTHGTWVKEEWNELWYFDDSVIKSLADKSFGIDGEENEHYKLTFQYRLALQHRKLSIDIEHEPLDLLALKASLNLIPNFVNINLASLLGKIINDTSHEFKLAYLRLWPHNMGYDHSIIQIISGYVGSEQTILQALFPVQNVDPEWYYDITGDLT